MRRALGKAAVAGAILVVLGGPVHAAGNIRTFVDGRELVTDTAPVVESGRTLVPARALFEALGATVTFEAATRTLHITYPGKQIELRVGSRAAWVDGRLVLLDVGPRIVNDRTLVPLRFVGEALGAQVLWNAAERAVLVSSRPPVSRSGGDGRAPGAEPAANPAPVPAAVKEVVYTALALDGRPYRWGGTGPDAFDCSGFTAYVLGRAGIALPRTSYDQYRVGTPVGRDALRPGDLVFFSTYARGPSHVGIYLNDGLFISAASHHTGVHIASMSDPYWSGRYLGARRLIGDQAANPGMANPGMQR